MKLRLASGGLVRGLLLALIGLFAAAAASPRRAPKFRGRIRSSIRWCSTARTAPDAMAPRASTDRRWRSPIRFIWRS